MTGDIKKVSLQDGEVWYMLLGDVVDSRQWSTEMIQARWGAERVVIVSSVYCASR